MIKTYTVTTTGSAGSATGTATTDVLRGFIGAIEIDYNASAPATTDVTFAEAAGLGRTLLTVSNNNTDGFYYPSVLLDDASAADTTAYVTAYIEGKLTISVAQADALDPCVTVKIMMIGIDRS